MPNVMILGRWSGHEGGALMKGTSVLTKVTSQPSLAIPATWRDNEKSVTQKRTLTPPCWHPDLRFLASRTVRNELLLLISDYTTQSAVLCYSSLNRLTQSGIRTWKSEFCPWICVSSQLILIPLNWLINFVNSHFMETRPPVGRWMGSQIPWRESL